MPQQAATIENLGQAFELVKVMQDGRIRFQGTGEELMHSDEVREAYLGL